MSYKEGDYEFRLYSYEVDELEKGLAFMVNCRRNKWEIVKIFEQCDNVIKVLFKHKY